MNAVANEYPLDKIEDLILLRLRTLLETNLIDQEKYQYWLSQIKALKDLSSDIKPKEIVTFGLIYKSLNKIRKIDKNKSSEIIKEPYEKDRSFEDVKSLLTYLNQYSSKIDRISTIFQEHFFNYEKNFRRLSQIREQQEDYEYNEFFANSFSSTIDKILNESQKKIEIAELSPKEEETILSLFEEEFSQFGKLKEYSLEDIPWDETLVQRAEKRLYATNLSSDDTSKSKIRHETSNLGKETNIQKTADKLIGTEIKIKSNEPSSSVIGNNERLSAPIPSISKQSIDPWNLVGKVLVTLKESNFVGIGILGWPMEDKSGKVYFPVQIEVEAELDQSDALFREIQSLRISGISDTSQSRKDRLREEISDFLNIPDNISLNPTFIKEYLAKRDIEYQIIFKEKILRIEFYPFDKITIVPEKDHWVVIQDKIKPRYNISQQKSVKSSQYKYEGDLTRKKVSLWTEESIGVISSQIGYNDDYFFLIEYDFPTKHFLRVLIPKIRGYDAKHEEDLWYLRFFVSKKLDIFEGEALLPFNLWRFVWTEKIPILPFDLRASFYGLIPSQTIDYIKDAVVLKRNQIPKPIINDEILSSYLKVQKDNRIIGSFIGFTFDATLNKPVILYNDLKLEELFNKLGKDSSDMKKLLSRIQRALSLKEEESKTAKAIITYLTFYSAQFATYEDLSHFVTVESWLISTFSLKKLPFEEIEKIDLEKKIIII